MVPTFHGGARGKACCATRRGPGTCVPRAPLGRSALRIERSRDRACTASTAWIRSCARLARHPMEMERLWRGHSHALPALSQHTHSLVDPSAHETSEHRRDMPTRGPRRNSNTGRCACTIEAADRIQENVSYSWLRPSRGTALKPGCARAATQPYAYHSSSVVAPLWAVTGKAP